MTPEQKGILKENILGLVKFSEGEGYKVKPYPKVILKEDNNPVDITAPTGHYNPDDNTITLYCNSRHPKDVLNTFAHELWHRHQDVEGKLDKSKLGESTSYTRGTPYLREIEDEAFRMGNVLRRKYTESLQG